MVKKRTEKAKKSFGQSLLVSLALILGSQGAVASEPGEFTPKTSPRKGGRAEKNEAKASSKISTQEGAAALGNLGYLNDAKYVKEVCSRLGQALAASPQIEGTLCLLKNGVNGSNTSMIVLDQGVFETDLFTNFYKGSDVFARAGKDIAHGTLVAASAASSNPESPGLAAGSLVFPMSTVTPETGNTLRALETDLEALTAESHAALKTYGSDVNAKMDVLLDHQRNQRWREMQAVNEEINVLRIKGEEVEEDLTRRWAELSHRFDQFRAMPINHQCLDDIIKVVQLCQAQGLPKPRVINMSLSFYAKNADLDTLIPKLTQILRDNDMLLVCSAGNVEGRVIGQTNELARKGKRYENVTDIRDNLLRYPELAERLIIVGALTLGENKTESYSTHPGEAKDHAMVSMINPVTSVKGDDQTIRTPGQGIKGTSFASPQVAAMAVVLNKYFPTLTMLQVKTILLSTAFKPGGVYDAGVFGQGGLDPLQAWLMALEESRGRVLEVEPGNATAQEDAPQERLVGLGNAMADVLRQFEGLETEFSQTMAYLKEKNK